MKSTEPTSYLRDFYLANKRVAYFAKISKP
jgi:hypothetical protein